MSDETPQGREERLQRVLARLDDDSPRLVDIGAAVVLSLATVASAWCAYQSSLWGGAETFGLVAYARAAREATENRLTANHQRSFDGSMFIEYMEARAEGSSNQAFLYERFRPELKRAVDAWLSTDPFNNPKAPPHPFQPDWYTLEREEDARLQEELSQRMFARVQEVDDISETYVLLTVLFASVLFFGGMAGTFESRRIQRLFGMIALVMFLAVTAFMLTLPVCRDCDALVAASTAGLSTPDSSRASPRP